MTLRSKQAAAIHSTAQLQYLEQQRTWRRKIRLYQWLLFILFFSLWELLAYLDVIDSFIFSSPSRVVLCIISMSRDGSLFYHLGITLFETALSFTLIIVLGLLAAVVLWWNKTLAKILDPYLVILNSLPKSALAPLFIIWLGSNLKTIIVAAVSVAIFGTILTLYSAFAGMEDDKLKLIRTLGGGKRDAMLKVVLPGSIPTILSVMKVNIGLSLVGVIIAEFIAAKAGLGYLIIYGSQVFKLDWVIMSILLLCLVATCLYQLLSKIEKRFE